MRPSACLCVRYFMSITMRFRPGSCLCVAGWSALFLFAGLATSLAAEPAPVPYQAPGTRRMAERLEQITASLDPLQNQFLNRARAQLLERQLADLIKAPLEERTARERVNIQLKYAAELLNAGKSEAALRSFNDL